MLAAVLTTVGGGFLLAGGLALWLVGSILSRLFGLSSPLFLAGAVVGMVAILTGVLMAFVGRGRRILGAIGLGCAVASIPLAFGGFVVGFVLVAVGGAIALARPRRSVVVVSASSPSGRPPPWT